MKTWYSDVAIRGENMTVTPFILTALLRQIEIERKVEISYGHRSGRHVARMYR